MPTTLRIFEAVRRSRRIERQLGLFALCSLDVRQRKFNGCGIRGRLFHAKRGPQFREKFRRGLRMNTTDRVSVSLLK